MRTQRVLLDEGAAGGGGAAGGSGGSSGGAAGGGSGGAGDWLTTLPEALRADPSLVKFKSGEELARGYINAQKLIGAKRLEAPQPTWDEKKWEEFYTQVGRPDVPDKYVLPEGVKPSEKLSLDEKRMKETREVMHKLGLTEKQGKELLGYYVKSMNESMQAADGEMGKRRDLAMATLRGKYGEALDEKIKIGIAAANKLGGEEFTAWLDRTGVGNDPELINVMVQVGEMMAEDVGGGGGGGGGAGSTREVAAAEISRLRTDSDFLRALTTQHDPGHAEAAKKWLELHQRAFPGKQS
jgi:hypothetical protein